MSSLKKDLPDILSIVRSITTQMRSDAYLVGGFIRDSLLKRESHDLDLSVSGNSVQIGMQVAVALNGKYVLLDKATGVARVILKKGGQQMYLDFSSFSGDIEEDLARRDFTINTMAINIKGFDGNIKNIFDPYSGKKDLKQRRIRAVNPDIFKLDSSRLLRAVWLAFTLNFTIEKKTEKLMLKDGSLVGTTSGERIREELLMLLSLPASYKALCYMDRINLLTAIIPELQNLKKVQQPKEHLWDVFNHSMETVATLEFLLRESEWRYNIGHLLTYTNWSKGLLKHFNKKVSAQSNRRQILKLAGLLHDLAKPATKKFDATGKMRFIGHASEGAELAGVILKRLRFSSKEINTIKILICHHLRPAQVTNDNLPSQRAVYRYFRDTGEFGIDVLFLALSDLLATRGPELDIRESQRHNDLAKFMLKEHQKQGKKFLPKKFLDGSDLMSIFGLSPGPMIGQLLNLVAESQAAGEISSREEAIDLVVSKLKKYHH